MRNNTIIPDGWKNVTLNTLLDLLTDFEANGSFSDVKANVQVKQTIDYAWYVRATDLEKNTELEKVKYVTESSYNFLKKTSLHGEELLITKRGEIGKVYYFNKPKKIPCTLAPNLYLLKLNSKVDSKFLYHFFKDKTGNDKLKRINASATIGALYKDDLKNLNILLPSILEQQKIAEILSTVDDKIEIIDQQITETQELKKGLMQRLLTKGIGHTKFKDSPLGMIPESWEVVKLGDITEQIKDGTHATHKEVEGGIPLLSAKDIRNGRIYIPNNCRKLSQEDFNSIHKNFKLKDDDILLTVVGSIGRVAVINNYNDNYTFQRSVGYIRLNNHHNSYFFKQYFQSDIFSKQLLLRSNASAQAGVYLGELSKILLVSLPIEQQKKIAEILSSVDDKLEVLLEKKTHYQELKQGLMQQLLTGKIRVKV